MMDLAFSMWALVQVQDHSHTQVQRSSTCSGSDPPTAARTLIQQRLCSRITSGNR